MKIANLTRVIAEQRQTGRAYLEFLRVPALSMGVYRLAARGVDPQKPHLEDEVYYVVSGQGRVQVGAEDEAIGPGSIIFVPARAVHHFHQITDDLTLLVFFAPAESS
jgi:mannose-6-phosphate isomerase-like protein (cupin superfamily)